MTTSSSASTSRAETDARAMARAVVQALPLLLVISTLIAAALFLALGRLTPVYRAEAKLLVESSEADPGLIRSVLDGEAQVIRSRDIALGVIADLNLAATPEYERAAEGGGLVQAIRVALGLARDLSDVPEAERVLAHYDASLTVRPLADERTLAIAFEAEDPELAARGANAIAVAYVDLRRSATTETAAMLDAEIERLRTALAEAERRTAGLRDELAGLPPALGAAERAALDGEEKAATEAAVTAGASATAIRQAVADGKAPDEPAFLDDPAVAELAAEQQALRDELAREMAANPLGNPRVAAIRVRLAAVEADLRAAAERIAAALEASAEQDRVRAAELAKRIVDADAAAAAREALTAELARLDQAMADDRERLATAEKRREALKESGIFAGDVRILSRASIPSAPVWPRVLFWTIAGFLGALVLGIVIVAVRSRDRRWAMRPASFEPLSEMELPRPAAARFRRVEEDDLTRAVPGEPPLAPTGGRGGESLGSVADSISGQRRVVVTLAEESTSDGRPLVAVALARALAGRDRSVVLLDLREDGANTVAMGEAADLPGFSDLLSGGASFARVIFRDRRSRAHFIAAGSEPVRPEALAGERLQTLLTALDHTYDHIIIDCPDDAVARMAPGADAALVASEHASADPRTVRAVSRIAKLSDARIFHLRVEPGRRPTDDGPETSAEAA